MSAIRFEVNEARRLLAVDTMTRNVLGSCGYDLGLNAWTVKIGQPFRRELLTVDHCFATEAEARQWLVEQIEATAK